MMLRKSLDSSGELRGHRSLGRSQLPQRGSEELVDGDAEVELSQTLLDGQLLGGRSREEQLVLFEQVGCGAQAFGRQA